MDYFWMYVKQNGQHMVNSEGTALAYDDKLFVDFMNISLNLRKAGAIPTVEEASAIAGLEDYPLVHGTAAIEPALNSNEFVAVSEAANRPLTLLLPPTASTEGRVMKNSQYFSVTANTKVAEEAAKFISYFTNDIEANKILLGERGVPFASKVRTELQAAVSEAQKATFVYVDEVEKLNAQVDPIYPPNYGGIYDVWKLVTDEIMYEKVTPEDGAKKFRTQADEILGKNKK
jgi:multiple sugar transport system substrate-binding protein